LKTLAEVVEEQLGIARVHFDPDGRVFTPVM
jgi:hypothetical protein